MLIQHQSAPLGTRLGNQSEKVVRRETKGTEVILWPLPKRCMAL